jgi:hypothetical protein
VELETGMKIQTTLAIAAGAALLMGASGASAANLISNGDFASGALGPWTLTGSVDDGQNTVVINLLSGASYPGGAFNEVIPNDPNAPSSNFGLYLVSDQPIHAGATQTFNVATAGTYQVSFDYYVPRNGLANPDDAHLFASVNSSNIASIDADVAGNDNGSWRTIVATETLAQGSNSFNFNFTVPGNVNSDGRPTADNFAADFVVSNVSVTGVPEPTTWAIMLVGFGGLGAAMRNTRRKQVATA